MSYLIKDSQHIEAAFVSTRLQEWRNALINITTLGDTLLWKQSRERA
jgi:hypothetical protein